MIAVIASVMMAFPSLAEPAVHELLRTYRRQRDAGQFGFCCDCMTSRIALD